MVPASDLPAVHFPVQPWYAMLRSMLLVPKMNAFDVRCLRSLHTVLQRRRRMTSRTRHYHNDS